MERFSFSRNGWGRVDENCQVRVAITSLETVNRAVHYQIKVSNLTTGQNWQVAHRYSEFLKLRQELLSFFSKADCKCPGCRHFENAIHSFEFPRKHLFNSNTRVVLNYRKVGLRAFLALLASHTFTTSPKCPLCAGFPFESVRAFLTEDNIGSASDDSGRFSVDQLRESIDVKDFIEYFAPGGRPTVNDIGEFIAEGCEHGDDPAESRDSLGFTKKPTDNPKRKLSASREIEPVPMRKLTSNSTLPRPARGTNDPAPKEAAEWFTDEEDQEQTQTQGQERLSLQKTKSRKSRSKRNRRRHSKKKDRQQQSSTHNEEVQKQTHLSERVVSEDDAVLDAFD